MRRLTLTLVFLAALMLPAPADAQSLIGQSKDCGTYRFDGDLVKGRTDSMIVKVDHTEGCYRYVFWTHIGTGIAEGYGYPGQQAACERAGREAAVGHFRWYRGMDIDGSRVQVACSAWAGGD